MWMQSECCDGYKVRGLQYQRGAEWRVMTWPEGKDEPVKHYIVKDDVFYKVGLDTASSHTQGQKASFGPIDAEVGDEEKAAVVKLIQKWEAQIIRS